MNKGTWKLDVMTGHNLSRDFDILETTIKQYGELCLKIPNHHKPCEANFNTIIHEASYTKDNIRQKRHNDVLGWLGHTLSVLLVGDDTKDELEAFETHQGQKDKLMSGTVRDTINAINESNFKVKQHLRQFQTSINGIMTNLDEMKTWQSTINSNTIDNYVLTSFEQAMGLIHQIRHQYTNFKGTLLTEQQFKLQLNQIQPKLPKEFMILPEVTRNDCKSSINYEEAEISISYYIPVVAKNQYELFKITPIPIGKIIINIHEGYIGLNQKEQQFFMLSSLSQINKYHQNYSIVPNIPVIHQPLNCPATILLNKPNLTEVCETVNTPETYDHWIQPSEAVAAFIFYTTYVEHVRITCNGRTETIQQDKGILYLDPNCQLRTKTKQYGVGFNTPNCRYPLHIRSICTTVKTPKSTERFNTEKFESTDNFYQRQGC